MIGLLEWMVVFEACMTDSPIADFPTAPASTPDASIVLELRIDWSEVDPFGHVNNLAIMKYVQAARIKFLETIGMMQHHAETRVGPTLVASHCQFKKQLFYPGQVIVVARTEALGSTSFQIKHTVMDASQSIVAEAIDVLVLLDFNANAKRVIPDVFRERILSHR